MSWAARGETSLLLQGNKSGLQRKRRRKAAHGPGVPDREKETGRKGVSGLDAVIECI